MVTMSQTRFQHIIFCPLGFNLYTMTKMIMIMRKMIMMIMIREWWIWNEEYGDDDDNDDDDYDGKYDDLYDDDDDDDYSAFWCSFEEADTGAGRDSIWQNLRREEAIYCGTFYCENVERGWKY